MKAKELRELLIVVTGDADIDVEGTYRLFAVEGARLGWRNEIGDGSPVYTDERDDDHTERVLILSIDE